jgi:hypothetical protein
LVGEGLQQGYLLLGERLDRAAPKHQTANGLIISKERDAQSRSVPMPNRQPTTQWELISCSGKVAHMDRLPIHDSSTGDPIAPDWQLIEIHGDGAVMCCSTEVFALLYENNHVVSSAEAAADARDGIEHRLKIEL